MRFESPGGIINTSKWFSFSLELLKETKTNKQTTNTKARACPPNSDSTSLRLNTNLTCVCGEDSCFRWEVVIDARSSEIIHLLDCHRLCPCFDPHSTFVSSFALAELVLFFTERYVLWPWNGFRSWHKTLTFPALPLLISKWGVSLPTSCFPEWREQQR